MRLSSGSIHLVAIMRVLLVLLILVIQKQKMIYALVVGCMGAGSILWGVWGTQVFMGDFSRVDSQSASSVVITVTGGEENGGVADNEGSVALIEHAVAGDSVVDGQEIQPGEAVTLGLDINSIRSAPKESLGITYCSKTARITLKSLTGKLFGMGWEYEIPQGDAITLILAGIQEGMVHHVGFADAGINPSAALFQMLAFEEKEVADVYLYRDDPDFGALRSNHIGGDVTLEKRYLEQGHRFVVVLGTDGILYALDPYRGDGGVAPQRLKEYVAGMQGWTMYVGNTYDADIDQSILTLYESSRLRHDAKTTVHAAQVTPEYVEQAGAGSMISVQEHLSTVRERNDRLNRLETVVNHNNDGVDYEEVERLLGL